MSLYKIVPSVCVHDCGGACPLSLYIHDDRIVKIESRDTGYPAMKPCFRGLLYHYRVYSPDRLKYPLKRTGERGEGAFKRISWDEALDTVAGQISRIQKESGPAAILSVAGTSVGGVLHNVGGLIKRFFSMAGGSSMNWAGFSYQGGYFASMTTYGRMNTGNERADLLNSKLIILWGCNPAESIFGTETRYYLTQAKEKGIRIISIDPRYTETAATWADQWIPCRPGTDAALLNAMAYVILKEGLHDRCFLEKFTIGFEKYHAYLIGTEDGIPKTPEWAEKITGTPAGVIRALALDYGKLKPAAIIPGFAPGRTDRGEQYHRAAATLAAMTGNIGIAGGSTACLDLSWAAVTTLDKEDHVHMYSDFPQVPNPLDAGLPPHEYAVKGIRSHTSNRIHAVKYWDAVNKGKSGGYQADIEMLYVVGGNTLNQTSDTNSGVKAFKKLKFAVVQDICMTATARYADIVLPSTTWCERNDIKIPWFFGHYAVFANRAIKPMYECRDDIEIFGELARKLGIKGYNDKTEDEWLRHIAAHHAIPDFESFKANGFYKLVKPPYVSFQKEIRDPAHNPFPTPSGKIEIFSQRVADFGRESELPAIPKYTAGWEGPLDQLYVKYPLQLVTAHSRKRVHSQFDNIPWYHKIEPHAAWLNPVDAAARNIKDGDRVKVFNERGTILIRAKVTPRIMPGVICVYEGAWFQPDKTGVDAGGCANVLTRGEHSPGGAFTGNTILVQAEKA